VEVLLGLLLHVESYGEPGWVGVDFGAYPLEHKEKIPRWKPSCVLSSTGIENQAPENSYIT